MKSTVLFLFGLLLLVSCERSASCDIGCYGHIVITNYSIDHYTIHYEGKQLFQLGPGQTYNAGEFDEGLHYLFATASKERHEWKDVAVNSCETIYLAIPRN